MVYLGKTKLSCDANGGFKGSFEWHGPNNETHSKKELKVKPVNTAERWTCVIKNSEEKISLEVSVNVVGMFFS